MTECNAPERHPKMCYCLPSQIEPSKVCEECGDDDAVVGLPLCSDCLWGTGAEA